MAREKNGNAINCAFDEHIHTYIRTNTYSAKARPIYRSLTYFKNPVSVFEECGFDFSEFENEKNIYINNAYIIFIWK